MSKIIERVSGLAVLVKLECAVIAAMLDDQPPPEVELQRPTKIGLAMVCTRAGESRLHE